MSNENNNLPANVTVIDPSDTVRNKIFVTIDGQDWQEDLDALGLDFDSSEQELMERIAPIIQEEFGRDITEHYKVRKAVNSENVFIIPNSTAG